MEVLIYKFAKIYLILASFALAVARIGTLRSLRPKRQKFAPPPLLEISVQMGGGEPPPLGPAK